MNKLKILHVGRYYWPEPGGMERAVRELCEGLAGRGHDVSCWVGHHRVQASVEILAGVRVVRFPTLGSVAATPLTVWSRRPLEEFNPDLIHIHLPNALPLLRFTATSKPIVVTHHSDFRPSAPWMTSFYNRLERRLLSRCQAVIVSSARTYESSPMSQWSLKSKLHVIPVGLEDRRLGAGSEVQAPQPVDLLYVGRLEEYKGLETLIYAMEKVDARLVVVGTGGQERRLKTLVRHLGLDRRVRFTGFLSDGEVAAHIHRCKILVLPSISRCESLGLSLIEAMACSKPIVSTQLPTAVLDINVHGRTGFVVPPGNVPRLSEALTRLLANESQRRFFGSEGRIRYLEHFTRAPMIDAHESLYSQILDRHEHASMKSAVDSPAPSPEL